MAEVMNWKLTQTRNNLTFHPQLILKPTRNPRHAPVLRPRDIWRILDPVPHVARRECQDGNDGPGTP